MEHREIKRELLKDIIKDVEKRIKEIQSEYKYTAEDAIYSQGLVHALIDVKISLEKFRKKLRYEGS